MQSFTKSMIHRLDLLNEQRVARALALMDTSAQRVFHLIPALFHYQHPALPGFVDGDTPFGIPDFQLDETAQQLLESLVTTENTLQAHTETQVLGLYTMGSTSSIGQSTTSDIDVWVCVSSLMSPEQKSLLSHKCTLLSQWASEQGVEASFFVMDEMRFKAQRSEAMTGDNCGSSQHILLLDEFYRSSMRIAGYRLLWQVVPPEMEECYDDYIQQLCDSNAIDCSKWIDFGRLNSIPAEEYFGANLWQLYKSIDSPFKSVLKAILLEAYSWEYPNTQLLSLDYKRRFFAHEPDLYSMDAYYLMLEKVTRYLERTGDHTRLELVRRCFYLKTKEKITREPESGSVAWRREALKELTAQWHWQHDTLEWLDNRRSWKVEDVKSMHHQLLEALMLSYRNLIQFARRNKITSAISPQDISILARKLYAAFEALPSKVTLLNPQIATDLHESDLTFIQVNPGTVNKHGWYLYKQPLIAERIIGQPKIAHDENLSKVVAWSFFNGLITESTRLHSVVKSSDIDIDKFYQMVSDLRNTFSLRKRRATMEALASPCEISQLALFINFENDPTSRLSSKDAKLDPRKVDVFSYGKQKQCLIGSVDVVYRNSWHEVRTMSFKGEHSLLDALKMLLGKMHQGAIPPESLDVFSYSQNHRNLIRNSVYQLLAECVRLRLQPVEEKAQRGYKTIGLGQQRYGLFFERRGVSVQALDGGVDFYRSVADQKLNGSLFTKMDRDQSFELPHAIETFASEGLIQFFFEDTSDGFNIYVLGENNEAEAYHQLTDKRTDKSEVIASINQHYTDINNDGDVSMANFNLPQYYQIIHPEQGECYVVPYSTDFDIESRPSQAVGL
ncbi:class I adenylate cyclase [Vibrio ulleungensis]|uniref:Class I adenylate cyclase n=1 Tax=Vibrio ulleungensis TaxID=2807619 RepID=A0ABS2HKI8_9VIBR|nr:class I adenylate cyclase [Vibrio ulleungensis]MBM7037569.1 class I adenylate cyclase [Vibrio ulleungensis]